MPGANPAVVTYNGSAVKIYNTASSLVRFENKIIQKNVLAYYNAGVVSSQVVGLAPGKK
jgi:hypothetical protein